jgi:hypothetical protein
MPGNKDKNFFCLRKAYEMLSRRFGNYGNSREAGYPRNYITFHVIVGSGTAYLKGGKKETLVVCKDRCGQEARIMHRTDFMAQGGAYKVVACPELNRGELELDMLKLSENIGGSSTEA